MKRRAAARTVLADGTEASRGSARVEAIGSLEELIAVLGLARARCAQDDIVKLARSVQCYLFTISAILQVPSAPANVDRDAVRDVESQIAHLKSTPGMIADWALPGGREDAASFDVAAAVCRRAERAVSRMRQRHGGVVAQVLDFLNSISVLLWLCARTLEARAGIDARLRVR